MNFKDLNLDNQLLEAISYMGFEKPTPIQSQAIPIILDNHDLIACAQTGTGKTGAFVLPILNKLVGKKDSSVNTLILVPTRELAIQIEQQIQGLSYFVSVGSIAVYGGGGGKDWDKEKDALVNGRDIIVATPGKLLSHLKLGYVDFSQLKHFVLDEADRMLDMGFIDDLKKIISFLPKVHQTLLFSATMPKSILDLAKNILKNPKEIKLSISKTAEGVEQKIYLTYDNQKIPLLSYLLKGRKEYDSIIIFTSTKSKVSEIVRSLTRSGFKSYGISSNLKQEDREEVLRSFRSKRIRILVATDVMSRGIDVKDINMVVNYDVPNDAEDYVHRVGRTARANTKGEACTLVNQKDMFKVNKIEKLIKMNITKNQPPKDIGEGPKWVKKLINPRRKKTNFYRKRK
ncbi:MAG: ATP-dependent RNA helicase [Crocinitomicaceae bacterium]|nr:ATP-dependent RNA helicase [Crocinitomicaceae bacterium]|tara:strand:- start:11868 stop:13070 length:1203 start_codon:yes stop_codon:yes gene_type:complete